MRLSSRLRRKEMNIPQLVYKERIEEGVLYCFPQVFITGKN